MKRLSTRNANTSERKKQIIHAALACFNELGVTETGMADICTRSKTSIGSIYHHFKSKDQLAAAVYIEGIKNYQDGFLKTLEKQTSAQKGIEAVVAYHLRWVVEHPEWSRYLFRESHAKFLGDAKENFKQQNSEFFKRVAVWFNKQIEFGHLKKLPPDIFVSILMGPCQAFSRQYLFHQACTAVETAAGDIAAAVWQALKADIKPTRP